MNSTTFVIYDDPLLQQDYVTADSQQCSSVILSLEGISCPSCSWKIESSLIEVEGIESVNVNYSTHTAEVSWQNNRLKLSDILSRIHELGFQAWPFHHKQKDLQQKKQKRIRLLRIGCAALFGMQVMMISIGLYFGAWDMDTQMQTFLHWVVMLLTVPVITYSGQPFYSNAWRDLKNRSLSMDVPVVLGITIAFIGSVVTTISGEGEVYFDSICMLILFLLISRYFEFQTRLNSNRHIEKLYRVKPDTANKIVDARSNRSEVIPAIKLEPGDTILVRAGENIPVDGIVIEGTSSVNEALLTGESAPIKKLQGDELVAGSTNMYSPLTVRVTAVGKNTRLNKILQLIEQGSNKKPKLTALINRFASWFIMAVILIACITGVFWYLHDASAWLGITISILVVTCPCALSLATPTAYTAANNAILANGVAVLGQNVLQTLATAQTFIFDKTGTLTTGELEVSAVNVVSDLTEIQCLTIAASLETSSEHQIARAILAAADNDDILKADRIINYPGEGVAGEINGAEYFLGNTEFIKKQTGLAVECDEQAKDKIITQIFLASSSAMLCSIQLQDYQREGVNKLIQYLKQQGKQTVLLSGDNQLLVNRVGNKLGFDETLGEELPEQKQAYINNRLNKGEVVVMVGDGINDAPSLAISHMSIAMGSGADISKLNADMILLNNDINQITRAHHLANRFMHVLKQNIGWAVSYNLLALPLAVSGLLTPWLAAIGMSVSSLIVVINSARLSRNEVIN